MIDTVLFYIQEALLYGLGLYMWAFLIIFVYFIVKFAWGYITGRYR